MNKIIIHWTAGTYKANMTDMQHYHYLIEDDGKIVNGIYKPEANLNCQDGVYAAHCGGGNTRAIGIAMCGMAGFVNKTKIGNYPLTKIQCERCFKLIAEVSKQYNIKIEPNTVMTHYEFGKKNSNTSSAGKIDIIYLPAYPHITQSEVGNFIRNKAKWYRNKI